MGLIREFLGQYLGSRGSKADGGTAPEGTSSSSYQRLVSASPSTNTQDAAVGGWPSTGAGNFNFSPGDDDQ